MTPEELRAYETELFSPGRVGEDRPLLPSLLDSLPASCAAMLYLRDSVEQLTRSAELPEEARRLAAEVIAGRARVRELLDESIFPVTIAADDAEPDSKTEKGLRWG